MRKIKKVSYNVFYFNDENEKVYVRVESQKELMEIMIKLNYENRMIMKVTSSLQNKINN